MYYNTEHFTDLVMQHNRPAQDAVWSKQRHLCLVVIGGERARLDQAVLRAQVAQLVLICCS